MFPFTANTGSYLPAPEPVVPTLPVNETSEYDCDFEKSFCQWKKNPSYRMQWVRDNGFYQSSESGPNVDHTLGTSSGYFAHIDIYYPNRKDDKARLESPQYRFTKANCLSFWYHMKGRDVNTLNLLIKTKNGTEYKIWSKSFNHGDKWLNAMVDIKIDTDYTMIFEALRGSSYLSDIAIDDVIFREGECPSKDYVLNCNFDRDLCGFINDPKATLNFTQVSGRIMSNTGPNNDHTVNIKVLQ